MVLAKGQSIGKDIEDTQYTYLYIVVAYHLSISVPAGLVTLPDINHSSKK